MTIDRVTITGADNSVSPEELLDLSIQYPFVEWGILASKANSRYGASRFPSYAWVERYQTLVGENPFMYSSLHLCGSWVRDLLMGQRDFSTLLLHGFQRVQLNFHAENTPSRPQRFADELKAFDTRQIIFQIDESGGNEHLERAAENYAWNCVGLFDISGGKGQLPDTWPAPVYMANDVEYAYHGYAGGLGPDNLTVQIPRILSASLGARIWIDMETRVRTADNTQLDLGKVRECLEIAKPYIGT